MEASEKSEIKEKSKQISELMGGDVQVWFEHGDQELVSRFRSTRTPELGSVSHLYLDMKNVSIFDRETELRL